MSEQDNPLSPTLPPIAARMIKEWASVMKTKNRWKRLFGMVEVLFYVGSTIIMMLETMLGRDPE